MVHTVSSYGFGVGFSLRTKITLDGNRAVSPRQKYMALIVEYEFTNNAFFDSVLSCCRKILIFCSKVYDTLAGTTSNF